MTEGYPLSLQQEHLFRLVTEAEDFPYRSTAAVTIEGELDTELLRAAGSDLVARYEVLRTVFEQPRGLESPIQVVREPGDLPLNWTEVDLSGTGAEEENGDDSVQLPETDRGPGLHLTLTRLRADHHRLLVSVSALSTDRSGVGHLAAALERAYRARLGGGTLDEEPVQAADLSAWQRDLVDAEGAEVGIGYWRRQDLTGLLHFRLPFERRGDFSFRPRSLELTLGGSLRKGITALATTVNQRLAAAGSEVEATEDDVLLAAWAVLLGRLAEQKSLVVGILGEGRQYEGLEEAVAPMARFLPLLMETPPGARFTDFLQTVVEARGEAEEWQEYFTWDHWRGSLRHLRGTLFFPTLFEHRVSVPPATNDGGSWKVDRQFSVGDRFRLRLSSREVSGGAVILGLDYDAELIEEGAASLLLERFEALLSNAVAGPEETLHELEMLSPRERQMVLAVTGAEEESEPLPESLDDPLERFRRWALEDPQRPAVRVAGAGLTYGALAAEVDRLAAKLRRLGVGPEVRVGLAAGRSPRTVVAILAVVQAGAAFVPLDPTYPVDRLRFMVEDAGILVLLAERGSLELAPEHRSKVHYLDDFWSSEDSEGAEDELQAGKPRSIPGSALAYIIYTSGSTGEPRGAMITRSNLAGYLEFLGGRLGIQASDRYLHTASISFSSSVRQLFLPLAHGAEVILADDDERRDPMALFARAADSGVTVLDLVPSHWRACIHALDALEETRRRELVGDDLPRLIVTASEPLGSDLPQAWRHNFGHPAQMINMFGQTETTGIVASQELSPPAADAAVTGVPVGRALEGTRLLVLDRRLRPVPLGVPGRVYVAGTGVGRGYLGLPSLSAERFGPDPYSHRPGDRLYDSGDVGAMRLDGVLELFGRADHQIKIRGLRVELGEIEAALLEHPSVREGVVAAPMESGSGRQLVAYVVPRSAPGPSADGLRTYLQERLPEYMVPAFYVILEELPLTTSGKIDRSALPVPLGGGGAAATYVAPGDEVEETLAALWQELLAVEQVGIHDNFFRLGGHSLLGTVLMTRLREAFSVDLPVARLFEAPTVAGLAAVIKPLLGDSGMQEEIPRVERQVSAEMLAVDGLSEDQVNALLGEMLQGEEG